MEIVKFYQEGGGDVWEKMGAITAPKPKPSNDDLRSAVSFFFAIHTHVYGILHLLTAGHSSASKEISSYGTLCLLTSSCPAIATYYFIRPFHIAAAVSSTTARPVKYR